ncbi:MAG: fatty acid desaturase family protein [Proteobacteria bacterium]|nr:fatty acid desaturase family protein [Pseudomonadota bacterium]
MATELPINRVLTKEELSSCLQRSNTRALVVLIGNYAIIAFAFALTIVWPNPLTILISVLLLGARQLGLEVLNHDCAHAVFFKNRRVNELVGHWLCGGPVNTNLYRYRDYHLQHHRHAGTEKDPDLALALTYPARRAPRRRISAVPTRRAHQYCADPTVRLF